MPRTWEEWTDDGVEASIRIGSLRRADDAMVQLFRKKERRRVVDAKLPETEERL